jgi:hypothetical protein
MRVFIFIVIFFQFQNGICQSDNLDTLIARINNNQIIDDGDWLGPKITLSGPSVSKLLEMGKLASNKLTSVLADSTRGIIAHCILSLIWEKGGRLQTYYSNRDEMEICIYNDLCFFRKGKEIYANKEDLERNKMLWEVFIR